MGHKRGLVSQKSEEKLDEISKREEGGVVSRVTGGTGGGGDGGVVARVAFSGDVAWGGVVEGGCVVCGGRGATVMCFNVLCGVLFHLPCAMQAGVLFLENKVPLQLPLRHYSIAF